MEKKDQFVKLIKEYEAVIFKITTVYTRDGETQKDLYQEIVYQLWKSFDSFRHEAKASTWLYRVALNTSITHSKKEQRKGDRVPIDQVVLDQIDQHDQVMEERIAILYAHIKMLSEVEKGLMLLFLEGKSYEEMSAITGFTNSNVGTRLARIKQKLKFQITK